MMKIPERYQVKKLLNVFTVQVTMNTLLDGHVKLGRMHDAESMLKAMEERGVRGNVVVYNTLLRGYARAGNSRVSIV